MQKIVFYCDRCGTDIMHNGVYDLQLNLHYSGLANDIIYLSGDFCAECYNIIKQKIGKELEFNRFQTYENIRKIMEWDVTPKPPEDHHPTDS